MCIYGDEGGALIRRRVRGGGMERDAPFGARLTRRVVACCCRSVSAAFFCPAAAPMMMMMIFFWVKISSSFYKFGGGA